MSIDFDFYLIDEVTSVGDANFKKKSADTLLEKVKTSGAIVVSHSAETLRQLCTSSIVIENARAYAFESVDGGLMFYNWCRLQYGEPADAARDTYNRALAALPKGASAAQLPRRLIDDLVEKEAWDQAVALAYVLVSEQRSGVAAPLVDLSRALRNEKDGRWVLIARAAVHTPDANADTHAFLAETFVGQQTPPIEEIRVEIGRIIEKNPRHPTIPFAQAHLHFLRGELDDALRVVTHAMETTPKTPRLAGLHKKIKDAMDTPLELTERID